MQCLCGLREAKRLIMWCFSTYAGVLNLMPLSENRPEVAMHPVHKRSTWKTTPIHTALQSVYFIVSVGLLMLMAACDSVTETSNISGMSY